jgi:Leucine-rich repeat (LRR) protein
MMDLQELGVLDLSNNSMTGSLPTEIAELTGLQVLDLHSNSFSGALVTEVGNLSALTVLDLRNNSFSGPLVPQLGSILDLELLDCSYNNLSGLIPTEIGNSFTTRSGYDYALGKEVNWTGSLLHTLVLSNNELNGTLPTELGLLDSLQKLDLSFNGFTGSIPTELGNLNISSCQILLLGNNFSGRVPESLCPWYCNSKQCSSQHVSNIFGSMDAPCNTTAWLEVDCSQALDCTSCPCL